MLICKNNLPGGESNPGLPRDRRGYSPLYYLGLIAVVIFLFNKEDLPESFKRCLSSPKYLNLLKIFTTYISMHQFYFKFISQFFEEFIVQNIT